MKPLYESPLFREAADGCLRPGGAALTRRGLALCGFRAGERVVDVGCGPGVTLGLLEAYGLHAVGVDSSPTMLREARQRSALPVAAGYMGRLPLRDGSVDGVICECVLSLASSVEEALSDMWRVLRPGGQLLLTDIVLREKREGSTGQGCAAGALQVGDLMRSLCGQGFRIREAEDHSRLLAELAGRLLFQGVPRADLLAWMGVPCGGSGCHSSSRLGYWMFVAEKGNE